MQRGKGDHAIKPTRLRPHQKTQEEAAPHRVCFPLLHLFPKFFFQAKMLKSRQTNKPNPSNQLAGPSPAPGRPGDRSPASGSIAGPPGPPGPQQGTHLFSCS